MGKEKKNIPVGTRVKMVNCLEAVDHAGEIWITRGEPWQLKSGSWLVLLKGYSGGFDLNCLEVIESRN
jgi:hypothetical protein